MNCAHTAEIRERAASLATAVARLGGTLVTLAGDRTLQAAALYRLEIRRVAMALALSLAIVFFVCGAAALTAMAVMLAMWESHRVIAALIVAGGFAVLAMLGVLLLRNATRARPRATAR